MPAKTDQTASRAGTSLLNPIELGFRGVGLMYIMTFALASYDKFCLGETPDWFKAQFNDTFMARLPGGLGAMFFGLAILEGLTALVLLASLASRKPIRKQNLFRFGLFAAGIVFTMLSFGQRWTHGYDQAGNLFVYGVLTFSVLILCSVKPETE